MIGTVLSTVPALSLLARVLGISRPAFYDIMKKHGVLCDERTVFPTGRSSMQSLDVWPQSHSKKNGACQITSTVCLKGIFAVSPIYKVLLASAE